MKLNCWFPLEANDKRLSTSLLILRVVFGVAMAIHGWPKFQNLTTWMGPDAPVPAVLQALAAIAEFLGGIAIALGALTPIAAFGNACTLLVAAAVTSALPNTCEPFVGAVRSVEGEHAAVAARAMMPVILSG